MFLEINEIIKNHLNIILINWLKEMFLYKKRKKYNVEVIQAFKDNIWRTCII